MKKLYLTVLCLSLTGCFLTPEGNKSTQTKAVFNGGIFMDDIQGAIHNQVSENEKYESYVLALFEKAGNSIERRFATQIAETNRRGLECGVRRTPLKRAQATRATRIEVGEMEFNRVKMNKTDSLEYYLFISRDYPSGVFAVKAAGSAASDPFTEAISMPEALRSPKVNGTSIETEGPMMKKSDPLKFEWARPASLDANNIAIVSVARVTESEEIKAECGLWESELWDSQGTTLSIEMPQQYLSQIPASGSQPVTFTIQRAHQFQGRNPAISKTIVMGSRIMASKGMIQE